MTNKVVIGNRVTVRPSRAKVDEDVLFIMFNTALGETGWMELGEATQRALQDCMRHNIPVEYGRPTYKYC